MRVDEINMFTDGKRWMWFKVGYGRLGNGVEKYANQ